MTRRIRSTVLVMVMITLIEWRIELKTACFMAMPGGHEERASAPLF